MKKQLTAVVCGGREYTDKKFMFNILDDFLLDTIIHGDARGADSLCSEYCKNHNIKEVSVSTKWKEYKSGNHWIKQKTAGLEANTKMLDIKPDIVIAFPGGRGTRETLRKAKSRSIRVIQPCVRQNLS